MKENHLTEDNCVPEVNPSIPSTIPKFVDELPIPKVLNPDKRGNNYAYYEIEMKCAGHKFHRDFCKTLVYGYNGIYPGPTIETMKDQAVYAKWINNLPLKHFLPVDKSLHGAIDNPEVRTVVHLHGANVAPESDGFPEAWFTRNYEFTGSSFSKEVYEYPNNQQATTLWYHDHSLGITRLNVYAGLAGFYIIHDFNELSLGLPKDEYDIPLIIQDKTFNSDGSLFYPSNTTPPNKYVNPSVVRAFIGATMVVNGKVWPYFKVEPRKYRFRILNASNTNGYVLKLSNGQSFYQIGTDGGLLGEPVKLESFPLDPAERIDVIIDFSKLKHGDTVILNTEETDFKVDVMQFKVELPLKYKDRSVIPKKLRPMEKLDKDMAKRIRRLTLSQSLDHYGRNMLMLNNKMFSDPATEMPEYDSIEIWEIANPLVNPPNVSHPIHLHLVQFQILNRQPFDVNTFNEKKFIEYGTGIDYTGAPVDPDPSERGWKDVVRVEPGKVTRIIAHFKNYTGDYIWHCHILEHEDHDMMRPLRVIKKYCD
ncbi:multicopper oxidase family protein [Clostridium oryzae]|uniref:Spore coat protein A n=1 Tax=Clostridium oryzae TaxID=1450648 RepID=A0A1V4IGX7_9CLOT|nr:multicopper oxidase [Clostridium oryzae]OPJ59242.1 spore coat protein A [Clostridium oryzae]